jgi:hypothetical protein
MSKQIIIPGPEDDEEPDENDDFGDDPTSTRTPGRMGRRISTSGRTIVITR